MDEADELTIHQRSRTDKTYVGPSVTDFKGMRLRIGNKYIDAGPGYAFCDVKDEITLRHSPGGRVHIKATFMEDDRAFQTVTLQKFTGSGLAREHFTFMPDEIAKLLKFLTNLKQIHFPDAGKVNITDADLEQLLLRRRQRASLPELRALSAEPVPAGGRHLRRAVRAGTVYRGGRSGTADVWEPSMTGLLQVIADGGSN